MHKAVVYLRSSKDRHDVSIDAQRVELTRVAAGRGLTIIREFVDMVESAKDEHRPAFQKLRDALKLRSRGWDTVLLLDPSRLSRNQYVAHLFTHDARQHGVTIVYARMPESTPLVDTIIVPLMHGFAEYYSLESKQKGLAGMTENVKRGFRAGGRAPAGYRLTHTPTGAFRDGQAVTKSKLDLDASAPMVAKYLKLRAAGIPRRTAKRQSGITLQDTTLIGLEWNALTYSGCTVWNVHAERERGAAVGGHKRRPRSEWILKEGTHAPLITREEAETLLRYLEQNAQTRRDRAPEDYLLGGLLRTPAGKPWYGCRDRGVRYYRNGRRVDAERVERGVIQTVRAALRSQEFVDALLQDARRMAAPTAPVEAIKRAYAQIEALDRKISSLMASLPETTAKRPLLTQIETWETEREKVRASIIDEETHLARSRAARNITESHIAGMLDDLSASLEEMPLDEQRDFLRGFIDHIEIDPVTLAGRINYHFSALSGDKMASPGGFEPPYSP